jgi:hypothetical protein
MDSSTNNMLSQPYMRRDCMIVAGLCSNAPPLFAIQLHTRLADIRYAHLSAILRLQGNDREDGVNIFSYVSSLYYKKARFIKERWQFLSCIVSFICALADIPDPARLIKMSLMQLSLRKIYKLFKCDVDACDIKTYYYWYDNVTQCPVARKSGHQ